MVPIDRAAGVSGEIARLVSDANKAIAAKKPAEAEQLARIAVEVAKLAGADVAPAWAVQAKLTLVKCLLLRDNNAGAGETLSEISLSSKHGPLPDWLRTETALSRAGWLLATGGFHEVIKELEPLVRPKGPLSTGGALAKFRSFLQGTPAQPLRQRLRCLLYLGAAYYRLGDYEGTERWLAQLFEENRNQRRQDDKLLETGLLFFALAKAKKGDLGGASLLYTEILGSKLVTNGSVEVTLGMADLTRSLGKTEASAQWCEKAISALQATASAGGDSPSRLSLAWDVLGHCRLSLGQPAGAEEAFREAWGASGRVLQPDISDRGRILNNIGVAQRDQGRLADALATLKEALSTLEGAPNRNERLIANALKNIGIVEHRLGNKGGAAQAFSRAMSIAGACPSEVGPVAQAIKDTCQDLGY